MRFTNFSFIFKKKVTPWFNDHKSCTIRDFVIDNKDGQRKVFPEKLIS